MSLTDSVVAVMLPTGDAARAQDFYEKRLGLPYDGESPGGELMFGLAGGSHVVLRPFPEVHPSPNTAMSFEVRDIESEIADLESRGVAFEDYDLPDLKTVKHVFDDGQMKAAWFLDPDGNVLCLHQPS
ncbi:VOC family protein [Nocardioides sp. YIM 152315]|uniref:VOC family protein n=1 Tax=Nocardioides sp. YIM 152315 TaxID=3031760 RepID=UPI0023D9AE9C|nr:VOC family protein [Nocardioides sp. YIM 152315]MDF1603332.1 VOC family protein [Nocardioides sp. YIM 152315]